MQAAEDSEDEPDLQLQRNKRVSDADLARIEAAAKVSEVPSRVLKAAARAVELGRVPAEAAARFAATRGKRDGSQVAWIREWAKGLIPECTPSAREQLSRVTTRDDETEWCWLNQHELVLLCGGPESAAARAYADKRWKAAKGRPEREHPEGKQLGPQRRFWAASIERLRQRREERKDLQLKGQLDAAAAVEQLAEALQAPFPGVEAEPCTAEGPEPPLKKLRGEDAAPCTREQLLQEAYKAIPRLYGFRDSFPGDPAGQLARQRLAPQVEAMLGWKHELERSPTLTPPRACCSSASPCK